MAKKKIILPIGTKAFAVTKSWVDKNIQSAGAKVLPCKLITYMNIVGKVIPVYQSGKMEITTNHYIYNTLEEAVEAISNPKK